MLDSMVQDVWAVVIRMESETDLFGNPVAPLVRTEEVRPPINDMGLIEDVLRIASTDKFVLVGPSELVFRRTVGEQVERVPADLDQAVHQLIDAKWLEVGGHHTVCYDRYTGPARSVLIPRRTRETAARWRVLKSPATWEHAGQATPIRKGA